jgi:hypothetical protein
MGNCLTGDQAQELLKAVSQSTLRGRRDAALRRITDRVSPSPEEYIAND